MNAIQVIQDVAIGAWTVLAQMAPWLLFGFLVAGILSVLISPRLVERHLGGHGIWPTIKASLFGVPLPLCSCGVIPVSASLRRHGASRAASISFLISTPQTGVDSIAVTYSLLGPLLAVFRPVAALVTGIVGGILVGRLHPEEPGALAGAATAGAPADRPAGRYADADAADDAAGSAREPDQAATHAHGPACEAQTGECGGAECAPGGRAADAAQSTRIARIGEALRYGFVTLPADLAGTLAVGILLAGLIAALLPPDFFAETLGCGLGAMLAMMAVGLPLYVCATASAPVAAAMMMKGVCPGAALVFLIAGPATNAATVTTIWKVMGRRTVVVYLAVVAAAALGSGYAFELLLGATTGAETMMEKHLHGAHGVGWTGHASAAALLLVLAHAALGPRLRRRAGRGAAGEAPSPCCASHGGGAKAAAGETAMETMTLDIEGMTCSHCRAAVERALGECAGVAGASVDLEERRARVRGTGLSADALTRAVEALGYAARVRGGDEDDGRSEGPAPAGEGA